MTAETTTPRVAVISAVTAAVAPAGAALRSELPDADVWNIIDDRLMSDARAQNGITAPLRDRMRGLIEYAIASGADAVLVTCSLYGQTVSELAMSVDVPTIAADDDALAEVAAAGFRRIVVAAPVSDALDDTVQRLRDRLSPRDALEVVGVVVPAAHGTADQRVLCDAIVDALPADIADFDAVLLGQYSLATAGALLAERVGVPVITTPLSAARALATDLAARFSS